MAQTPSLFGIQNSNRNFADAYYWGKNQFNSSFPVALANYMAATGHAFIGIYYANEKETIRQEIGLADVYQSTAPTSDLYFGFESRFEPFSSMVHDELPAIDLVVCAKDKNQPLRPLEIKLTTLPDNTTEGLAQELYGAEIVIRSATTRYMTISIARSVAKHKIKIRELFDQSLATVRNWDSKDEIQKVAPQVIQALEAFLNTYKNFQTPLLMQPVWKTVGKSPQLASKCLDIFVWTDFALAHLFLDSARTAAAQGHMNRQLRAAIRLSRFIYEACRDGRVYQAPIFDGMTYDWQNDKEFAVSGARTRALMAHPRLVSPIISKDEIKNIILGGGQKFLSPERRFDAILYFSTDLFGS